MLPVVIESPYGGDTPKNLRYFRACMHDCLLRGEAPFGSHGLYTQPGVLNDDVPEERKLGITAGFEVRKLFAKTVFYMNLGESDGMRWGRKAALELAESGHVIEERMLPEDWEEEAFKREMNSKQARDAWIETMIDRAEK